MSLAERIENDVKNSLKSGDKVRVSVLRMIKSAMKNREIEKGSALSDDDIQQVFRAYAKKNKESIEQFSAAGRSDLADKEKKELEIINEYLPAQMSEEQIRKIITDTISETGASGSRDIGKVMKAVMGKTRGQADGKTVNELVKQMLEA